MDEDWKHLTESSLNLNLGQYQTPRINRSLQGIEAEAQRLSSRPSKHVSNKQLKNFAAKAGVNIQSQKQYISAIDELSTSQMDFQEQQQQELLRQKSLISKKSKMEQQQKIMRTAINTMDLQNFLRDHHNYVISSTVSECQEMSGIKFRKQYELSMEEEWDCAKQDILNYFGMHRNDNDNNHNQSIQEQQTQKIIDYPKFIYQQKLEKEQSQFEQTMDLGDISNCDLTKMHDTINTQ